MKIVSTVLKVLAALAAVAGVVYLLATYGDKLVAWAKRMLGCAGCEGCECCEDGECCCEEDCDCCCDEDCECCDAVEAAQEAPSEEAAVAAVQAEEADFEN